MILSVYNSILQVRDQVQLHKTQFLADVLLIDVQRNTCDKKQLDILIRKKSGSEASGTIRLHSWTSYNADTSQRQADGLYKQTIVVRKKTHDTINHALHVRYKEKTLNSSIQLLFCPEWMDISFPILPTYFHKCSF